MMCPDPRKLFACGAMLPVLMFAGCFSLGPAGGKMDPAERCKAAAVRSAETARRAGEYRETAVHAVENALAVCDEAGKDVLKALESGGPREIKSAVEGLERTLAECSRAVEAAERTIAGTARAVEAADAASAVSRQVVDVQTPRRRERVAREAERLAVEADRALSETFAVLEKLREKWLIP